MDPYLRLFWFDLNLKCDILDFYQHRTCKGNKETKNDRIWFWSSNLILIRTKQCILQYCCSLGDGCSTLKHCKKFQLIFTTKNLKLSQCWKPNKIIHGICLICCLLRLLPIIIKFASNCCQIIIKLLANYYRINHKLARPNWNLISILWFPHRQLLNIWCGRNTNEHET